MQSSKTPKYLALSRKIEAQIREGRWKDGNVLSARVIARENSISMVTAARALQVLRDNGLIQTIDRIGSYVTPPEETPLLGETWSLCARITPGNTRQARLSLVRDAFRETSRSEGFSLEFESFTEIDSASVDRLREQARRVIDAGSKGLFLLPSRHDAESALADERLVEACRLECLPVVLIERNLRGSSRSLENDLVASDDLDGGYRCTTHLLEQGRRRVAFVNGSTTSSHQARLAGYLLGISQAAPEGTPPLIFEEPWDIPSRDAYRQLAESILARRADGVVCYQDHTAVGLIMELLTRGVRVPRDIGITGFDDLLIGQSFALGVTTYPFSWHAIASEAIRVMRRRLEQPAAPIIKCLVPSRLIVRESSVGKVDSSDPHLQVQAG